MKLKEIKTNGYTPYSGVNAMALVQSRKGHWFAGVRIENISFPLTISAAQNALFCCLSEGYRPAKIFVENENESNSQFWLKEFNLNRIDSPPAETSLYPVNFTLNESEIASKLKDLLDYSVSGYSNFPVTALAETDKGFISGVNIEVSHWNQGLCAERVALAKAITYGFTEFIALHIYTRDGEYNSPCGACRQVIVEHLPHHPVYLHHADNTQARHFSSDLLPYNFQSSTLQKNPTKNS